MTSLVGALEVLQEEEITFLQRLIDQETVARRFRRCGELNGKPSSGIPKKQPPAEDDDIVTQVLKRHTQASAFSAVGGPINAAKRFKESLLSVEQLAAWAEKARIDAIMDGCKKSMPSVRSGVRCYIAFAKTLLRKSFGDIFPPSVDDLLVWSTCFRCDATFSNYLGYVRTWCLVERLSTAAFSEPAIKRAKASIRKRGLHKRRKKMFLQHALVKMIVEKRKCDHRYSMLYLLAYIFMLRLPSEALPAVCGNIGIADSGEPAVIYLDKDVLCLRLKCRKNKQNGSLLKRECWCNSCPATCPVHRLWPYLLSHGVGQKPFAGITAANALTRLRCCLSELRVPEARYYRTHDLRRGHAKDMVEKGAELCEILAAGEWRSPAFMCYLDESELEKGAVTEAHCDESSSEDEGDELGSD